MFLVVVTRVEKAGQVSEGKCIYRIADVQFISLTTDRYDAIATGFDSLNDTGYYTAEPGVTPNQEFYHPCEPLKKLFQFGTFYFSPTFDLTRPLSLSLCNYSSAVSMATVPSKTDSRSASRANSAAQVVVPQADKQQPLNVELLDPVFWWNRFLLKDLLLIRDRELNLEERDWLDNSGLLVTTIQGYFGSSPIRYGNDLTLNAMLLSRVGCKRAGTRYLSRGVDDDGNVANFVETEFLLATCEVCQCFTQVRGTVPVFWEQTGVQWGHRIEFSRSSEATFTAVAKHFEQLLERHPPVVHVVNLLGQKPKSAEAALSAHYRQHFTKWLNQQNGQRRDENLPTSECRWIDFDLNDKCRGTDFSALQQLFSQVQPLLRGVGTTLVDLQKHQILEHQAGVLRTNCVDCLDRTNVAQKLFADMVAETFFAKLGVKLTLCDSNRTLDSTSSYIASVLNGLWAENGDAISQIYAGTRALKSGFTRSGKQTVLGLLGDAAKAANRFVINNFQDKGRQEVIQAMLGVNFTGSTALVPNPVHGMVSKTLKSRVSSYASFSESRICMITFNVNGKLPETELDLLPVLEPALLKGNLETPPIVAIALQEIVEMSASSFATGGSDKLLELWMIAFESSFKELVARTNTNRRYSVVNTGLLVGIGLILFMDTDILPSISHVERCIIKTGFGGMAGNKGAVAIAFRYEDTSVCLLNCHLAAGDRVDDRLRDALTIKAGVKFSQNGNLDNMDVILWGGDLNFRIELPNEQVRQFIIANQVRKLLESDQLLKAVRMRHHAFEGFHEAPIAFLPTYKYDLNSDVYDSRREKARTPGYTDRILYRIGASNTIASAAPSHFEQRLESYNRCEIKISDHRPVYATAKFAVCKINRKLYQKLERELYAIYSKQQTIINSQPASVASFPENNNTETLVTDNSLLSVDPPPVPYRRPLPAGVDGENPKVCREASLINLDETLERPDIQIRSVCEETKEEESFTSKSKAQINSLLDAPDEWGEFKGYNEGPTTGLENPFETFAVDE